jgi:hypothetical protein
MATDAPARLPRLAIGVEAIVPAAYGLGALALAGEAAVHVQQFAALFHDVRWIGPLFLANAVAIVTVIAGLAIPRTRQIAALAGVLISALTLGSLVVSYGHGFLGWQEGGFRTPVAIAVITEVGAVVLLTAALTGSALLRERSFWETGSAWDARR